MCPAHTEVMRFANKSVWCLERNAVLQFVYVYYKYLCGCGAVRFFFIYFFGAVIGKGKKDEIEVRKG